MYDRRWGTGMRPTHLVLNRICLLNGAKPKPFPLCLLNMVPLPVFWKQLQVLGIEVCLPKFRFSHCLIQDLNRPPNVPIWPRLEEYPAHIRIVDRPDPCLPKGRLLEVKYSVTEAVRAASLWLHSNICLIAKQRSYFDFICLRIIEMIVKYPERARFLGTEVETVKSSGLYSMKEVIASGAIPLSWACIKMHWAL